VKRSAVVAALTATLVLAAPVGATTHQASMPWLWKNCSHVNSKYHHGVGKRYAVDKTSGEKVTNFKRSTLLYRRAMSYNKGLDRDHDGIACEKL
jgi:hypothetical protein